MYLNVQFIQAFCEQLYSLTNFLSLNSVFSYNIRSKQYKGAEVEGSRRRTAGSRRNRN